MGLAIRPCKMDQKLCGRGVYDLPFRKRLLRQTQLQNQGTLLAYALGGVAIARLLSKARQGGINQSQKLALGRANKLIESVLATLCYLNEANKKTKMLPDVKAIRDVQYTLNIAKRLSSHNRGGEVLDCIHQTIKCVQTGKTANDVDLKLSEAFFDRLSDFALEQVAVV